LLVVSCWLLVKKKYKYFSTNFHQLSAWPLIVCPTSLKQGNQLLQQVCSSRACQDAGYKLAVNCRPSIAIKEAFGFLTDNQQPTTHNQLIPQPITGHFRQKGARRYLSDLEPSRTFGPSLKIQTEKPGVFNNPFSDQPGVGTSMPISNWIGIADGLQAIPNLQSQI